VARRIGGARAALRRCGVPTHPERCATEIPIMTRLRLEVLSLLSDLERHVEAWSTLADACAASPFSRPEWVIPFARVFAQNARIHVVLAWSGAALVGVVPLYELEAAASRWGRALGCLQNEHTPEGELLLAPDHARRVVEEILAWAKREGFCAVRFANLVVEGASYGALGEVVTRRRVLAYEASSYLTNHTEVAGSWDAFLARRSKNFRKQLKQAHKSAERLALTVDLVETAEAFDALHADLLRISRASWQGRNGTGTFADVRAAGFYREATRAFARSGRLALFVCRKGGVPIGFVLHLVSGSRLEALKSEFDESEHDAMVGWQIGPRAYQLAHERGLGVITMGTWLTDFKRRWTTRTSPCHDMTVFTPMLRGALGFVFPHLAKELAKRALGKPSAARCLPLLDFALPEGVAAPADMRARPVATRRKRVEVPARHDDAAQR
jgi:CelD/BcsL family acetyltransferase involved in cellulose biosynthesis